MLYICTKFHENISKGFLVIARAPNHDGRTDGQTDGRTDGQTDGQGDYYRAPPTSSGGALLTRDCSKSAVIFLHIVFKGKPRDPLL